MEMISSAYLNRIFLCIGLFFAGLSLSAQNATLQGQVLHLTNAQALAKVKVTVHETNQVSFTDSSGRFSLNLKKGHYHLHFEKPDFAAKDIDLVFNESKELTLFLSPTRIELSELLIEDSYLRMGSASNSKEVLAINPKGIEQGQNLDLGSLLESLPGVNMLNTGLGISKPVIRGFMGNRVAVIDQGIKQEGQQWGMDHGLEIDPFQAKRMEIVKGPAALQYGSDALGGALKILPDLAPKNRYEGSIQSVYHSNNNTIGLSAASSFKQGKFYSTLRVSHRQYQDFKVPAEQFVYNGFVLPITDGTLKNTAGQLSSANWNFAWQSNDYRARYLVSYYEQKQGLYPGATGVPRAYDVGQIGPSSDIAFPRQEIKHYKLFTLQNIRLADHWLELEGGFQRNDRAEQSIPHAHGFEELDSSATLALGLIQDSWQLNARYRVHLGDQEILLGTAQQMKLNKRDGFEYLIPNFETYQSGSFALSKGELSEKWHWDGGLRWEYKQVNSELSTSPWWANIDSIAVRSPAINRSFSNLAGAFGVSYKANPFWLFKAHMARSFRAPNIAELSSNGVHHGTFRHEQGSANLNPELAWQLDLQAEFQQETWLLRLSPYVYYFENFIFLSPSAQFSLLPEAGQLYRYQQAPVIQGGAELLLDWHPVKNLHVSNAAELLLNRNLNTNLPLPFSPPWNNRLSVNWETNIWQLGADWQWTLDQNQVDRNERRTPGYHLFALNFAYTKSWKLHQLTFNAAVQNLFNVSYLRHLSRYRILNLPEQGRNIILGFSYSF